MSLLTLLLLQLASGQPSSTEAREAPRVRAGIHFAVAAAFSGFAPGMGPGLSTELGATLEDRYSLVARLTVGTIFVVSVATLGLGFDLALSERLSLGVGVALGLVGGLLIGNGDLPFSLTVFAPVRFAFAPFARAEDHLARRGLLLFVEVGPGYGLAMSSGFSGPRPPPSPLSVEAAIGVGYAVW
ncbi:MAG: hypothetical protein Q8L48_37125 [Archangium sp.]|nr:hypothetical protein [Archangium sp.]